MLYNCEDKYYLKTNKCFTEVELIVNENDVIFAPTNNRVAELEAPIEMTFQDAKNKILKKDEHRVEEVIMEEEMVEEKEVKTFSKPENKYNKYNKYKNNK